MKATWNGTWRGTWRGSWRGSKGEFKQDMLGDLLSSSGQVRSRSGLVHFWFSLQPKFNSFELDSEVGRLVVLRVILNPEKKSKA